MTRLTEERLEQIRKSIPTHEFMYSFAAALLTWKEIEIVMFLIFDQFLNSKIANNSLVVWAGLFDIRRQHQTMNLMAEESYKTNTDPLKKWQTLSGRISAAIGNRNRLAHWSMHHEIDEEKVRRMFLVPNLMDIKYESLKEAEKKKVSANELESIVEEFTKLLADLRAFLSSIEAKETEPTSANTARA